MRSATPGVGMYAISGAPRRWLVGLGLADVWAHLLRPMTRAATRPHASTAAQAAVDGLALPADVRLRIATVVALSTGILFLPLEARTARPEVHFALLALYALHTLLTSFILVASHTERGVRHADALAVVLVLGHAVDLHLFVRLWPAQAGLAGAILGCLLVGGAVLFSWSTRRTLALAVLIVASFTLVGETAVPVGADRTPFSVASLVLAVGAATAVGTARLLAILRAGLAQRERELTALSDRLVSAQEEERRRLARELHDELGQSLTAVNTYLWLVERSVGDDATLRQRLGEARHVVSRTLGSMRELSQLLRPSVLDDLGLIPSLESDLAAFERRHGVRATLTAEGLPERLSPALETALYRITQEALTNVARHARATRVRVALATMRGELRLEIEDDGVGLPRAAGPGRRGLGLVGIRERARAFGGALELDDGPGTRLRVRLPLGA
jgi:signal transduction histidine kinase